MTTSSSSRRTAAAFLVTGLVLTSAAGRCDGQESAPRPDKPDLLQAACRARQAAEREAGRRVRAACVRAAFVTPLAPEEALELLKRARDQVHDNPDLSEACRERLTGQLECFLWGVLECGIVVKGVEARWEQVWSLTRLRLKAWQCHLDFFLGWV